MNFRGSFVLVLVFLTAAPLSAGGKKKNVAEKAMLEEMEAVPCGAKEKGLTGLGTPWGSAGITHVNSDEKLCPQYLLRTDEMEYHIRPTDTKHGEVLPVGHEIELKIKKDRMYVKNVDSKEKTRTYRIVAMKPTNPEGEVQSSLRDPARP